MRSARKYTAKGAPDWGEVKAVYVLDLQHGKCAYCEKELETGELDGDENVGAVEQDVEHFRPKNAVDSWEPDLPLGFELRSGAPGGYYLLAYDLWNYCVACKVCNTRYKGTKFPIEGRAARRGASDLAALNRAEKPLLLYPIGDVDDDPEDCIGFEGFQSVARAKSGRRHRRAITTIEFFALNIREALLRQRCDVIVSLHRALLDAGDETNASRREQGTQTVLHLTSDGSRHANCARSFHALFLEDPKRAYALFRDANEYAFKGRAPWRDSRR